MLKSHNFCLLKDSEGENDVNVEINPDKKHLDIVKLTMDGKTATINKHELQSLVFMISKADTQAEMAAMKSVSVTQCIRSIKIKAQKDIKKGEEIIANVAIDIPTYLKKKFKGLKKPKTKVG